MYACNLKEARNNLRFSVQLSFALLETLLDIFKGNANYTIYKCMAEGEMCDLLAFFIFTVQIYFFSEKQIKSIGSAITAQIDTTGKETETECTIKKKKNKKMREDCLLLAVDVKISVLAILVINNTFIFLKTN